MILCVICKNNTTASYKCPVCRAPYCTVECFKLHKELKCEQLSNSTDTQDQNESYKYETEDTIPLEKLKLLDNNKEILTILHNKHVRNIVKDIDTCKNPNEMLELAMKEPIFVELVDACLRVVEHN